jgi:tetratricopeptide (TPR) repeat protein
VRDEPSQERYDDALKSFIEARDTFQAFGEPRLVATAWHQIGMVYQNAGHFEASEHAYRQSLAIKVRENDHLGQAATLTELGSLYGGMHRYEDAATLQQQAAGIYMRSGDLAREGKARNNLAISLVELRCYDEARQELQRTIECKEPYGHAAEPSTTWAILEGLERATSHSEDAQAARDHAIETYFAYRRAGGDSYSNQIPLFSLVAQAVRQNTQDHAARKLNDLLQPDSPPWLTALIRKLRSVLAGDRDPALAADVELDIANAAELRLLLDTLDPAEPDRIQE